MLIPVNIMIGIDKMKKHGLFKYLASYTVISAIFGCYGWKYFFEKEYFILSKNTRKELMLENEQFYIEFLKNFYNENLHDSTQPGHIAEFYYISDLLDDRIDLWKWFAVNSVTNSGYFVLIRRLIHLA